MDRNRIQHPKIHCEIIRHLSEGKIEIERERRVDVVIQESRKDFMSDFMHVFTSDPLVNLSLSFR